MGSTEYRELAVRLVHLEERLNGLSRPQLIHSSIEGGALKLRDGEQLVGQVGLQADGTFGAVTLAGPRPPTPIVPTLEQTPTGVRVKYDGNWETLSDLDGASTPQVAPLDLAHFEVHVSTDPAFTGLMFSTKRGEITSARGGELEVLVGPGVTVYARIVARTTAGKASLPSARSAGVDGGKLSAGQLDVDIYALGGNKVSGGPTAPTGARAGDLWVKEPENITHRYQFNDLGVGSWVERRDQGITKALTDLLAVEALAQDAADVAAGRAQLFVQTAQPAALSATAKGIWYDSDDGNRQYSWTGTAWAPRLLGNRSVEPNSLVASDVIATGTVTAALLEAIMVLATTLIAGNPNGDHARMEPTGFRVFRDSTDPNAPSTEVVRMGTDTNDYFAVVNALQQVVAAIDDTGVGTFRSINVQEQIYLNGYEISSTINAALRASPGYFSGHLSADLGPIRDRVGIAEVNVYLTAGRRYDIHFRATWRSTSQDETRWNLLATFPSSSGSNTAPTPSVTTPSLETWWYTAPVADRWNTNEGTSQYVATTTGRHRFLLTVERGAGTGDIYVESTGRVGISVDDKGASTSNTGRFTQGGGILFGGTAPGEPPPAPSSYDTGWIGWIGKRSWRGDGTLRTDLPANMVVQGWDPSGFNGDGRGTYWFILPDITGTVNRVDLYLYSSDWYFPSGGQAIFNHSSRRGIDWGGRFDTDEYMDMPVGGARTVTVPSRWFPRYRGTGNADNDGRASTITLGPGNGTNGLYYGRFTDCKIRIWYTQ